MKDIILQANDSAGVALNLSDLQAYLGQLTDTRKRRGRIYPLSLVLIMIVLAKLSGEDKPSGIASWIRNRQTALVKTFELRHDKTPCLNTIRTILQTVVSLEELETLLRRYVHARYGGQQSELIALDGKTLRGTIPKGASQGVHLLAAYLPEEGVVLQQVAVENKENEIVAAPRLLADLPLRKRVVCADAMHTQRTTAVAILAAGGDYIMNVKQNQPTLAADVAGFFKPPRRAPGWHIPAPRMTTATTTDKGHGRLEVRTLTLTTDTYDCLDWPSVRQVFKIERQRTCLRTGHTSRETAFGITSCPPDRANSGQLLQWLRSYWRIENGLHYRRDVTFQEDATRCRFPLLAQAIATLNNFVVTLISKLGYTNFKEARRQFDAMIAKQLFSG